MPLTTYTAGQVLTAASLNANFAAAGGLTLIKTQTIGSAVAAVTVTDVFSSTYNNYKIIVTGGSASTSGNCRLTLGATATGYYSTKMYVAYTSNTVSGLAESNIAYWGDIAYFSPNGIDGSIELRSPNLAARTHFSATTASSSTVSLYLNQGGFIDNATQYTAFTLTTNTGTITGGTIRVYGYANS